MRNVIQLILCLILCFPLQSRAQVETKGELWDPDSIAFKLSHYRTDTLIKVTLHNTWSDPVTIEDLILEGDPDFMLGSNQFPLVLNPDEAWEVRVSYAPSQVGKHSARLIALSSASSDTLVFEASAVRTVNGAYWDQDSLWFSPGSCTNTSEHFAELNNDSDQEIYVDSVSVVGIDAQYYRIISSSPPGRVRDFVVSPGLPGNGVQYRILFEPNGTTRPHGATLVAHTSQGKVDGVVLIGIVPSSNVDNIDTTFKNLKVGVDHTFTLHAINTGAAPFRVNSIYWSGELEASISDLGIGEMIRAKGQEEVTLLLRSDVAGSKAKTFVFRGGECDTLFEIRIAATFGDQSTVSNGRDGDISLASAGNTLLVRNIGSDPVAYRVVDVLGRIVKSGLASDRVPIDVSNLSAGSYVFVIQDHSLKFIKH